MQRRGGLWEDKLGLLEVSFTLYYLLEVAFMKDVIISVRIPEELREQITTLAQMLRRNRSWVIKEALRGYIESERQFLEAVAEGVRADEEGRVASHATVMKEVDELIGEQPNRKR